MPVPSPSTLWNTERLRMRPVAAGDGGLLFDLDSDPDVVRYTGAGIKRAGRPLDRRFFMEEIFPRYLSPGDGDDPFGFWMAFEGASGGFAGWFHLLPVDGEPDSAELGFRLRQCFWGWGYATEGTTALIARAFGENGFRRVTATALDANGASIRVMQKSGLKFVRNFLYDDHLPAVEYALDAP